MSASTNPGNFANRPTEEVKAIASMGGKAAHGKLPNEDSILVPMPKEQIWIIASQFSRHYLLSFPPSIHFTKIIMPQMWLNAEQF